MPRGMYVRGEYSKLVNTQGNPSKVFWSRVDKINGPVHPVHGRCWDWTGAKLVGKLRYGQFRGKKCHRVSYELTKGPIPSDLQVLHKCDNPSCVRPDHLFLGTGQDNVDDKCAKGRQGDCGTKTPPHGSKNGRAKITDQDVLEARSLKASGMSVKNIHAQLGLPVSESTLRSAIKGKTWRELK